MSSGQWRKWRFWGNFAKVIDEMIRANKLNQLEGPRNVGKFDKNGEFSESGEMIRAIKSTQLQGPRNVCEFGENGGFDEVVDEMIRVNNLPQLEGPQNVGEFGKCRVWRNFAKVDENSPTSDSSPLLMQFA